MSHFTRENLQALEVTARIAAHYVDACDTNTSGIPLDPDYYRACGDVLVKILSLVNPELAFTELLKESAAAREVAENVGIGRRIETSKIIFYPQLAAILNRAAA